MAELDTIKAAEVAAGLGGRNDVVDRNGQLSARQVDLDQLGTELFVLPERRINGGAHVGTQTFAKKFFWNADAQTVKTVVKRAREIFRRHIQ